MSGLTIWFVVNEENHLKGRREREIATKLPISSFRSLVSSFFSFFFFLFVFWISFFCLFLWISLSISWCPRSTCCCVFVCVCLYFVWKSAGFGSFEIYVWVNGFSVRRWLESLPGILMILFYLYVTTLWLVPLFCRNVNLFLLLLFSENRAAAVLSRLFPM